MSDNRNGKRDKWEFDIDPHFSLPDENGDYSIGVTVSAGIRDVDLKVTRTTDPNSGVVTHEGVVGLAKVTVEESPTRDYTRSALDLGGLAIYGGTRTENGRKVGFEGVSVFGESIGEHEFTDIHNPNTHARESLNPASPTASWNQQHERDLVRDADGTIASTQDAETRGITRQAPVAGTRPPDQIGPPVPAPQTPVPATGGDAAPRGNTPLGGRGGAENPSESRANERANQQTRDQTQDQGGDGGGGGGNTPLGGQGGKPIVIDLKRDGLLSAADANWAKFRVWRDASRPALLTFN